VVDIGEMVGERRADGEETGEFAARLKAGDHIVEIDVGQAVAVIGKEDALTLDLLAHGPEPLADIAPDPRIDQRDPPLLLRRAEKLDAPLTGNDTVGKGLRPAVQEEVLDDIRLVAEAENEIVMAVGGIVLHDVAQDRLR